MEACYSGGRTQAVAELWSSGLAFCNPPGNSGSLDKTPQQLSVLGTKLHTDCRLSSQARPARSPAARVGSCGAALCQGTLPRRSTGPGSRGRLRRLKARQSAKPQPPQDSMQFFSRFSGFPRHFSTYSILSANEPVAAWCASCKDTVTIRLTELQALGQSLVLLLQLRLASWVLQATS